MGICALLTFKDGIPATAEDAAPLQARLSPRTAPDWALCLHGPYLLLSDGPIHRADGWWAAGDIRLDNRDDLLPALGLPADTGDLALALAAFMHWGEAAPDKLVGDYAVVLVHPADRRVFAFRDCLGNRPLFFHDGPACFAVAGAAGALADLPTLNARPDPAALMMWLQNDYDDQLAMYTGIRGLRGGHALTRTAGRTRVFAYWHPELLRPWRPRDVRDYGAAWRAALARAVADRCVGATAVGSTLSGGLDSASVTAFAAQTLRERGIPLHPFSFRFSELTSCDESSLSAEAAAFLDLTPHWLDGEAHWLFRDVLMDGRRRETPFIGFTALDHALLSRLAALGGNLLFTGHGGDNVNTGIAARDLLTGRLQRGNPGAARTLMAEHGYGPRALIWRAFLQPLLPRTWSMHLRPPRARPPVWLPAASQDLWHAVARHCAARPPMPRAADRRAVYELLLFYAAGVRRAIHYYHRLAPAYGIEARHPYFDRRLFELMLRIPPEHVRPGHLSKQICRENMAGLLPPRQLNTLSKPLLCAFYHKGIQLERPKLKKLMERSFLADMGLVDPEILLRQVDAYLAEDPDRAVATFITVVMAENWLYNEQAPAGVSGKP